LIGENIPVYQEQGARSNFGFPQPPYNLERGVSLPGACRHYQQQAFFTLGNLFDNTIDSLGLVIPRLFA